MAYSKMLRERISDTLASLPDVEVKSMFGGICYMVNGKMCIGIIQDEMMCRIGPANYENALKQPGCREMTFTGKPFHGYVLVSEDGMNSNAAFEYWVNLCLAFNPEAKASKKTSK